MFVKISFVTRNNYAQLKVYYKAQTLGYFRVYPYICVFLAKLLLDGKL